MLSLLIPWKDSCWTGQIPDFRVLCCFCTLCSLAFPLCLAGWSWVIVVFSVPHIACLLNQRAIAKKSCCNKHIWALRQTILSAQSEVCRGHRDENKRAVGAPRCRGRAQHMGAPFVWDSGQECSLLASPVKHSGPTGHFTYPLLPVEGLGRGPMQMASYTHELPPCLASLWTP